jgi:hypothetical protein
MFRKRPARDGLSRKIGQASRDQVRDPVEQRLPGDTDASAALLVAVVDGLSPAAPADHGRPGPPRPGGQPAGRTFFLFAELISRAGLR